ncbi:MAG: sensor histidine kinase, partial [Leadbetterella sp.]|nr:sensor histidine kinase [Leadbetterella sp.]
QKQEIESKQTLIGQQRLMVGLSVLFLLILAVLSYFLYKNYAKQKALSRKNSILMHEQNHRVKNNLQVISSMLSLQVDYLNDPESQKVFSESQTRIDCMVHLHRQLYENSGVEHINIRDLLHDVTRSVAFTFGFRDFEAELNLEVEFLKTDTATSIGLVFNELLINSFKYAFTGKKPMAAISSKQSGQHIKIIYRDFGQKDLTEIFKNPAQKSFGLNLVDMILFQINGTLDYSYNNGSVFTISFINI